MKIAIAGINKYISRIENTLVCKEDICKYLDNDMNKQGKIRNGIVIESPYHCKPRDIDYIIITFVQDAGLKKQLYEIGFCEEQVLSFLSGDIDYSQYNFLDVKKSEEAYNACKIDWLTSQIQRLQEEKQRLIDYLPFEIYDKYKHGELILPNICTVDETCDVILEKKVSMSRYGDGEFQIIFGETKTIFQKDDEKLAERLKNILISNEKNHIVALADDYGRLEGFNARNKDVTRKYMTDEIRKKHYRYIDMEKKYYNAYISRPYVIYDINRRDEAKERFDRLKQIWNGRDVLVVEGNKTRMGVGNDLLDNAKTIKRIIAPNENAFSNYDRILKATVDNVAVDELILIALGPTATVLAYDLAKLGYWALDIGHLDLEYEWFLKGQGYSYIPNKYNNEMPGDVLVADINDEKYKKSIIAEVLN